MKKDIIISLKFALVTLLLTGIVYPLLVTGAAKVFFAGKANASLVADHTGRTVGSELIAQKFTNPAYLQPRPSAVGHDASTSGGSNLGPTSKALRDRVSADVARFSEANQPVPADLVTTSASGLDPHITLEGALWQAQRIAKSRGVSKERTEEVIRSCVEGRTFGFLGEPRVNVLMANLALDRHYGSASK